MADDESRTRSRACKRLSTTLGSPEWKCLIAFDIKGCNVNEAADFLMR
jgi:hypothetical protein